MKLGSFQKINTHITYCGCAFYHNTGTYLSEGRFADISKGNLIEIKI